MVRIQTASRKLEAACGRVETTVRPVVALGQDSTGNKVYSLGRLRTNAIEQYSVGREELNTCQYLYYLRLWRIFALVDMGRS